jgi:hypothetical protein
MRVRIASFCIVGAVLAALPAHAVLIATGDGTGNTSAPSDDPGSANVGACNGATAVYLGNGWVLTAGHVGPGQVTLGGVGYLAAPESALPLHSGSAGVADLVLFRVLGAPPLRALAIASTPPAAGQPVVMIGNGRDRGAPVEVWGRGGYAWGPRSTLRWGTNLVSESGLETLMPASATLTYSFTTEFSQTDATPYEAQAAEGDSGGPVFAREGGRWTLAGIMFSISPPIFQPADTSLFGNLTYAADLARYRDQILAILCSPASDDVLAGDPSAPDCSSLDGGVLGAGRIEVSPTLVDLGAVAVGSRQTTLVAISNTGTADLVVHGVEIEAVARGGFVLTAAPVLPFVLPPVERSGVAGVAYLEVVFAPSSIGQAAASLAISSDDPDEPMASVDLDAMGTWTPPASGGHDPDATCGRTKHRSERARASRWSGNDKWGEGRTSHRHRRR